MNAAFDEARTAVDLVPLYLVNGSLGAGKTSLLEFLLQCPEFAGSRVIENEFANQNVDGYRLERLAGAVTTLYKNMWEEYQNSITWTIKGGQHA